tara:strand:- start:1082 stop:1678 length:597 start_codon:yes stop_codon:yes gene_type:complete
MAFFIGDEIVLKHSKLSVTDKMVYFCLITFYNRKTAACYPRIATIAKRLNVSKRTVQRSLARLKTLNFLQIKRKQSTNEYVLIKQQQLLNSFRGAMGVVSDVPNMVGINRTIYNRTNSNFKKNKSHFSNFKAGGVAKPINKIIFNGITLKYFGSEGLKDEYRGSDGELYTRNKLNDKIEKVVSKKKTLKFDRFIIKAS